MCDGLVVGRGVVSEVERVVVGTGDREYMSSCFALVHVDKQQNNNCR